jgi:hypothetical protein
VIVYIHRNLGYEMKPVLLLLAITCAAQAMTTDALLDPEKFDPGIETFHRSIDIFFDDKMTRDPAKELIFADIYKELIEAQGDEEKTQSLTRMDLANVPDGVKKNGVAQLADYFRSTPLTDLLNSILSELDS